MTRALRELGLGLFLAGCLSGCTVTARSAGVDEGPSNGCSAEGDCPEGSGCFDGMCQTLNGKLESLLIEVTPASDSALPHVPLIVHQQELPPPSGDGLALKLTRSQHVQGSLRPPVVPGCERTYYSRQGSQLSPSTDGESMPVKVTLRPREAALGLPTQIYSADATVPTVNMDDGIDYKFDLNVPAGSYDVYYQPVAQSIAPTVDGAKIDESCRVPPQLFRATPLVVEHGEVDLDLEPHPTTQVEILVEFPDASTLDGWVVDIIDSLSGLPISTTHTLGGAEVISDTRNRYQALLAYSGAGGPAVTDAAVEGVGDLVRLRPPAGVVAPTVVLDRAGLGLFGGSRLTIDGFTRVPSPVTVQGQLSGRDDGGPTSGRVLLVSTSIVGIDLGILGSYQTVVAVGDDGLFEVELPPGQYRVFGVPSREAPARSLSAYETSWDIPADARFQAGRLLELPSLAQVHGQTGHQGAEVRITASPRGFLPFEEFVGGEELEFIPSAFPGLVDEAGRFVLRADPGRFDIAVRPPAGSDYAWSVRPSFEVEAGVERELGRMPSRVPWVVSGVATVGESVVVGGALVRAYAYLDENLVYTRDPEEARSVIQVAETRTDEQGKFRLFVPDDILPAD